jgi:hypothetical protein
MSSSPRSTCRTSPNPAMCWRRSSRRLSSKRRVVRPPRRFRSRLDRQWLRHPPFRPSRRRRQLRLRALLRQLLQLSPNRLHDLLRLSPSLVLRLRSSFRRKRSHLLLRCRPPLQRGRLSRSSKTRSPRPKLKFQPGQRQPKSPLRQRRQPHLLQPLRRFHRPRLACRLRRCVPDR